MVSSYKGTENNEQSKDLLLTLNTNDGLKSVGVKGVFRTEAALIDQALRKGTLYRATDEFGNLIAIAPKQIVSIGELMDDED